MHMKAIGDHTRPGVLRVQRRTDYAGRPTHERRHGVVEMGKAGEPFLDGGLNGVVVGIAVTGPIRSRPVPRALQFCPGSTRSGASVTRVLPFLRLDRRSINSASRARQLLLIVHAFFIAIEYRPFNMDPQRPRHTQGNGLIHRCNGLGDHLRRIADQGRQKSAGAKGTVRSSDGLNCCDSGAPGLEAHRRRRIHLQIN